MRKITFLFFILLIQIAYAQNDGLFNSGEIIDKGIDLHDEGKYQEALELYNQVERNDSNYVRAIVEKAVTYNTLTEYNKVIELCKEGLTYNTGYENFFYNNLGTALDNLGENDKALEIYLEATKEFPYNYLLFFNLGVTYENLNQINEAIKAYQKAIDLNLYYSSSHYRLGKLLVGQGRLVPAMYSLSFYILLDNTTERSRDAVGTLQEISNGSIDQPTEIYDEDLPFQELDLILRSKLAMNKKYKTKADIDDNYVKQLQVLCEKTPTNNDHKNFWLRYYTPYFRNLFNSDYSEYHTYFVFNSYNNEQITKWLNKNSSKRDNFIEWATNQVNEIRDYTYINIDGKENKVSRWYYDNNALYAIGNLLNVNGNNIYVGPWKYMYSNGRLETIGYSDMNGNRQGEWKWYHPNGALKEIGNLTDNLWNGKYINYHDNGVMASKANYVNDTIHGTYEKFHRNGQLLNRAQYENGKLIGKELYYYQNGNLEAEYNYKNGVVDSLAIFYHQNGNISTTVEVKNEMRNGPFKSYYETGKPESEGKYIDNTAVGEWKWYYNTGELMTKAHYNNEGNVDGKLTRYFKNGKKEQIEHYKNGKVHGVLTEFDTTGIAFSKTWFKDDIINRYKSYNPNDTTQVYSDVKIKNDESTIKFHYADGEISGEGNYLEGKKHGEWKYYHLNGYNYYSENYKNGTLNGKVNYYYPDNSLMSFEMYSDNIKDGEYEYYHRNSKLSTQGRFKASNQEGTWKYYNSFGNLSVIEYYVKGKPHGYQTYYFSDGRLGMEVLYKDGIRNKFTIYDTLGTIVDVDELENGNGTVNQLAFDGKLRTVSNYKNGYLNGKHIVYYADQSIEEEYIYVNDMENGLYRNYFRNGKVQSEGKFVLGKREGEWKVYYKNGNLKNIINYYNDNYQGEYKHYYFNGNIEIEGKYEDGLREGEFIYYSLEGEIQLKKLYKNGIRIAYTYLNEKGEFIEPIALKNETGKVLSYFQNGKISSDGKLIKGEYQGEYKYYSANGNLQVKLNYLNNQLHGITEEYYLNGKIKEKIEYQYGELHGKKTYYTIEGNVEKVEHYKFGELNGLTKYYDQDGNVIKTEKYLYDRKIS